MEYKKIAEKYFQNLKDLEEDIKDQKLELEALRYKASGAGAIRYDKVNVITSSENRLENIVADLIKLEKMHSATVKTYENKKAECYQLIKQIQEPKERTLLIWLYVQNESIRATAKKMYIAERSAYTIRNKAFESFGKLLEKIQIYT